MRGIQKGRFHKIPYQIRITKYELDRLKKLAKKLEMKPSEYVQMIVHDSNDHYERKVDLES